MGRFSVSSGYSTREVVLGACVCLVQNWYGYAQPAVLVPERARTSGGRADARISHEGETVAVDQTTKLTRSDVMAGWLGLAGAGYDVPRLNVEAQLTLPFAPLLSSWRLRPQSFVFFVLPALFSYSVR